MFFILSKILAFLISPVNWIIACLLIAVFKRKEKRKKWLLTGLILLVFFTNPFIINLVLLGWEVNPVKISDLKQQYEAGIMMGGTIRYYNSDTDRPVFGQGADRYMQIVELYSQKKIKKIILTSGSGSLIYKDAKESDFLRNQLLRIKIDSADVISESNSRNTYENAQLTAQIIKEKKLKGPFILVTSAFHMRRSMMCFKKAGIDVIPFSVDQRSGKNMFTPDKIILPDTERLNDWDLLLHEWLGLLTYKILGYC